MKPTEQKLLILDLLKLNKSEKMYSEETVINIIKQVLKKDQLVTAKTDLNAEDKPCNKCTYNGHTTVCDKCNDFNGYEHFVYNDPCSNESKNFFKLFIKARKELCTQSPTETYSLEEAIRKAFDKFASQHPIGQESPKDEAGQKTFKKYSESLSHNEVGNEVPLKSPNTVSKSGQKTECYPPEFVEWIRKLTAPMNFMSNYHLFKFWQETINK